MTQATRVYKHSAAGTDWAATVVGAEGWLCDAMATAVMVAGQDGAKWFGQPELAGYQVFAVTRHEQTAWSI
jgi:thiamine biosynthesis lipoprotein